MRYRNCNVSYAVIDPVSEQIINKISLRATATDRSNDIIIMHSKCSNFTSSSNHNQSTNSDILNSEVRVREVGAISLKRMGTLMEETQFEIEFMQCVSRQYTEHKRRLTVNQPI